MWSLFSIRYIKNDKAGSLSLAVITFMAAVFLSLITGIWYNLWIDYKFRNQITAIDSTVRFVPWVFAYAFIMAAVCFSLVVMIHNAFEVSMNTRMRQMGILQSIGATPKQIRSILMQEALVLCMVPILAGVLLGTLFCFGFIQLMVVVGKVIPGYEVRFHYHIAVGLFSVILSVVTAIWSAWLPARRISRLTPLEAIHFGGDAPVRKMKRFFFFSSLFGIYGELARKSIYSRRKSFRTSTLSLAFSFLALISFLNFEAISRISTEHTYFDRYRGLWDIKLTMEGEPAEGLLEDIRETEGVQSCVADEGQFMILITPGSDEAEVIAAIRSILPTEQLFTLTGWTEQERSDVAIRNALNIFIGILASLLALIGLSNVFAATFGQIHQRKREFARYLSLGISPGGMKKILLAEVLIISFSPLLLGLLINTPLVLYALDYASITVVEFLEKAPWLPVTSFAFGVFLCVAFAYYLSGRQIFSEEGISVLKDETML